MTLAYFAEPTPPLLLTTRTKAQQTVTAWQKPTGTQTQRLSPTFKQAAWQVALNFGKRTTIHGLDRLLVARASRWERFIWLCTFISAFLGALFVCRKLSRRYNAEHFQTVIENARYPVYRVPFPVITICNKNRLNWQRLAEAQRIFMPNSSDAAQLTLFERIISSYDDVYFGHFGRFGQLQDAPLEELNHINFSLVMEFMTWRCDELLADCEWRHTAHNCCDIFSLRRSQYGLCWAFNTLETEQGKQMQKSDPMWPWRVGNAGLASALTLRAYIHPAKHWPGNLYNDKGITVMVSEQLSWHTTPFNVPAFTRSTIEVDPIIYFNDNDTRSISSTQRECVFHDEHSSGDFKSLMGYSYMMENCQSQCHQEHLVKHCNCTLDLFFPPGQYRACRAQELPCLAEHNGEIWDLHMPAALFELRTNFQCLCADYFRYSYQPGEEKYVRNNSNAMICKCLRNCYSLSYVSDLRSYFLPPKLHKNVSFVDLDVHYRFETMMMFRTSLVFGWIDLLVGFGGIVGLFLGCSLISGMELSYFLLFEIPAIAFKGICERYRARRRWQVANADVMPSLSLREDMTSQLDYYLMQLKKQKQAEQLHKWPQRVSLRHKHDMY